MKHSITLAIAIAVTVISLKVQAAEEITDVIVTVKSSSSTVTYNQFDKRPPIVPKEGEERTTPKIQQEREVAAINVQRFAVTIKNNSEWRIQCRLDFYGFEGRLGGYIKSSDNLSALIEKKGMKTVEQPQQLLMTSADSIEVKCFKFGIQS